MANVSFPALQSSSRRLLITLVVDTSQSMREDDAIGQLNRALSGQWRDELRMVPGLARIGEIALISFGANGVTTLDPSGGGAAGNERNAPADAFVPLADFSPRALSADGPTPMVDGIRLALDLIGERRKALSEKGIGLAYRPVVFLLTDGAPSDDDGLPCLRWRELVPELRRLEHEKSLLFFAFGVRNADMQVLRTLAPDSAFPIDGTDFSLVLRRILDSIERAMQTRNENAQEVYLEVQEKDQRNRDLTQWFLNQGGQTW
jgi:uncharacterized protein YegL